MMRLNRVIRFSISFVVISAIVLVLSEILLRVFDPIGIKYFFENERYFSILEPNSDYSYIHPRQYKGVFQGVEIATNELGFRGPEVEKSKKSGTSRVLLLGDSVVLGWGVQQDKTFPYRIHDLFSEDGRNIEIIPMGVSSWNTRNQFEYLRLEGIKLSPDLVVLIIVPNDVLPKRTGNTDIAKEVLFPRKKANDSSENSEKSTSYYLKQIWNSLGSNLYFVKHIQYLVKRSWRRKNLSTIDEKAPKWLDAKLALDGIIDLCESNDVDILFFLYGQVNSSHNNGSLVLYKSHIESRGYTTYEFPSGLHEEAEYRISFVDGHANVKGHNVIAETLHRVLNNSIP